MGGARTYGFGRVSPAVTPSPYSPLHRASEIPGSPSSRRRGSPARRRSWRFAGVAAVVVALLATVTLVSRLEKPAPPVVAKPSPASEPLPVLADDEVKRLPRSAIAVHRSAPRPRS
jgi:hypothetical protein